MYYTLIICLSQYTHEIDTFHFYIRIIVWINEEDAMEHNILQVIALAEKLKYEMRHSWLSNGRQESVAEHTWRMSLMAILVEPYLDQKVNIEKLLKMVIIHDLVEAEAGDIPAFDTMNSHELQLQKQKMN